jgi:hypothetical protein
MAKWFTSGDSKSLKKATQDRFSGHVFKQETYVVKNTASSKQKKQRIAKPMGRQ